MMVNPFEFRWPEAGVVAVAVVLPAHNFLPRFGEEYIAMEGRVS